MFKIILLFIANDKKKVQKQDVLNIDKNSPEYTICQKMSLTEDKTIVQYLYDEGKCGKICRTGESYASIVFSVI